MSRSTSTILSRYDQPQRTHTFSSTCALLTLRNLLLQRTIKVPKTVADEKTIHVPRQVLENKTVTVNRPRVVMEEREITVQETATVSVPRVVPVAQTIQGQVRSPSSCPLS